MHPKVWESATKAWHTQIEFAEEKSERERYIEHNEKASLLLHRHELTDK
jgi:hypothetical protein